jgi:methylated-DNA-[protein]-cysteine S-methyltransferase
MTTDSLHVERVDSPIGRIEITSDGAQITSLSIERDGRLPHDGADAVSDAVLAEAVRQLDEYFAGDRTDFDLPVRLEGTAFQKAVWAELQQLDFGQFTSYGEIGAAIGRPGSGRAIGGAVGANPVPIIVGCHRVLSSTGRITGFSAGEGIPTKVWLLDHESIGHSVVAEATATVLAASPIASSAAS